jgi:hypothetical protein
MRLARVVRVLPLLLTMAGSLAAQLPANSTQRLRPRDGLWFNAGLGVGTVGGGTDTGGISGTLALGWAVNQNLSLAVATSDWRVPADRTSLNAGTLDLRVQFYPEKTGGFFLAGGLGLGYFWMDDGGSGPNVGRGILVGLGFDARVAENASITTFINGVGIHTSDPRAQAIQAGVGVTFH